MSVAYRFVGHRLPGPVVDDLIGAVNSELAVHGCGHLSDLNREVTFGDVSATLLLGHGEAAAEIYLQLPGNRTCRIRACEDGDRSIVDVLEDDQNEFLPPSEFIQMLVADGTFFVDDVAVSGEPLVISDEAGLLQVLGSIGSSTIPTVVAVGLASDELVRAIQRRVVGTARLYVLREELVANLATAVYSPVSNGCVVIAGLGESRPPQVIGATLARDQPGPVARRVQRVVAEVAQRRRGPERLDVALRRLRSSPADADAWLGEVNNLENLLASRTDELVSRTDSFEMNLLELDDALGELDDALRRVRYLEGRLRELGESGMAPLDASEDEPADVSRCSTVVELATSELKWLSVPSSVLVAAAELDAHPEATVWAKKAWRALQALNDYARMKEHKRFEGDFLRYCEDPPTEATAWSPSAVALHESESTMASPGCRKAREFRVPESVSATRVVVMEPHIKVIKGGNPAPRIHFFDDTKGITKRVHIGYFGGHLPTAG